jgi:hypothetical protein
MNHPTTTRRNLAVIDALAWPALVQWGAFQQFGPEAFGLPLLLIGIWTLFRLNAALENRRMTFRVAFPMLGMWIMPGDEIGGGPYRFTTALLLTWAICGAIILGVFWGLYLVLGP